MLEDIRRSLIHLINSTYLFIAEILEPVRFLDSPGTYVLVMVVGLIFVPFLSKSIYYQYAHPHEYHSMPLVRKAVMSALFVGSILLFGYANFIRFL
jgi:hypothetical protein